MVQAFLLGWFDRASGAPDKGLGPVGGLRETPRAEILREEDQSSAVLVCFQLPIRAPNPAIPRSVPITAHQKPRSA